MEIYFSFISDPQSAVIVMGRLNSDQKFVNFSDDEIRELERVRHFFYMGESYAAKSIKIIRTVVILILLKDRKLVWSCQLSLWFN